MAKDPLLNKIWLFYRGRGRRRRSPWGVALMVLATLALAAVVFFVLAMLISGKSTPNLGDDPMEVPRGS